MCEATFKLNQAVRIFISSRLTIWLYLQELSDKGCDFFGGFRLHFRLTGYVNTLMTISFLLEAFPLNKGSVLLGGLSL